MSSIQYLTPHGTPLRKSSSIQYLAYPASHPVTNIQSMSLSTQYDPQAVEDKWYQRWLARDFFHSETQSW